MATPFSSDCNNNPSSSTQHKFSSLEPAIYRQLGSGNQQDSTTSSSSSVDLQRFSIIDSEINNLHQKILVLEDTKKLFETTIKKSKSLLKLLTALLTIIPPMFMLVFYLAVREYMDFAPDILKNIIMVVLVVYASVEAIRLLFYIPHEINFIKEDIQRIKERM